MHSPVAQYFRRLQLLESAAFKDIIIVHPQVYSKGQQRLITNFGTELLDWRCVAKEALQVLSRMKKLVFI